MAYKVLYRKYRPDDFNNLVGQGNIVKILKNSIINDKLSHAYIFSGPRGTGKTSSAKIFAKNVNCLNSKDGVACGKCVNCLNIENSSDIIEIDAASNNGVDEMRELINNVKLVPTMLKYKVYIIDEVHMLSASAFNALLLTLEEPPSHVLFILATTNVENIPITILSRCQRFDFKKITIDDIFDRLKKICSLENIKIEDEAILQIAKISDGGLRDSLSLLDQLSKENEYITENIVTSYSGNVTSAVIINIIDLINKNDAKELEKVLQNLFNQSVEYKLLIKNMISQIAVEVMEKIVNNKVSRLTVQDYKKMILDLTDFQTKINVNVDVYSLLLVILFSYIEYEETTVANALLVEKKDVDIQKRKKNDESLKIISANVDQNSNFLKDIRINNCFALANKEDKMNIIPIWEKFISESDISIRGFLFDTSIAMCSQDIITIAVDRENDLEELENKNESLITDFFSKTKLDRKLVLVSQKDWKELVLKYKKDKESGIIYTVKDESKFINKGKVDVDDIFDNVEEI